MQILTFSVKNKEMSVAFSGDHTKQWFVEDLDGSNRPLPVIKKIEQGVIYLSFHEKWLNGIARLKFFTEGERSLAADIDGINQTALLSGLWQSFKTQLPARLKKLAYIVMITLGIAFLISLARVKFPEAVKQFGDIWKETNVVAISEKVTEAFVEDGEENYMVASNDHPVYESEDVKAIESKYDISFKAMFRYTKHGHFLMQDVLNDKDGEPLLMTKGQAENECEKIGTQLMDDQLVGKIDSIRISKRSKVPEWTDIAYSWRSDDYEILLKDGVLPDGAYKEDGKIYGDDGDVLAAARCAFRASDFE